jgi:hypothetical protein
MRFFCGTKIAKAIAFAKVYNGNFFVLFEIE